MEKLMSYKRIALLAVVLCLCLPVRGSSLMRDPSRPGIVVLEGHSDPPISAHTSMPTVRPYAAHRTLTLSAFSRTLLLSWGPNGMKLYLV